MLPSVKEEEGGAESGTYKKSTPQAIKEEEGEHDRTAIDWGWENGSNKREIEEVNPVRDEETIRKERQRPDPMPALLLFPLPERRGEERRLELFSCRMTVNFDNGKKKKFQNNPLYYHFCQLVLSKDVLKFQKITLNSKNILSIKSLEILFFCSIYFEKSTSLMDFWCKLRTS